MPTLITLWLLIARLSWDFAGENLGKISDRRRLRRAWLTFGNGYPPAGYISRYWNDGLLRTKLVGVSLAILLVYIVGVFVGNLIGRTTWRLAEMAVLRIPLVRAIYPACKTDNGFLCWRLASASIASLPAQPSGGCTTA